MRDWDTYGAFGDTVVELSFWDILKLLLGRTLTVSHRSIVIRAGYLHSEGTRSW